MQPQRHQVEEGKVYIIRNGEPIELPVVNGKIYIVDNDIMTLLPTPCNGFGTVTLQYANGEMQTCKVEEIYKKTELLKNSN